ncbi:ABC transporter ATP-binding protein [Soehngenia longivitae]|uniref:ABC-type quaternary amine transporter n=1 Tax=Soehngenia longivitae TaxID=2562294 RepID=A0A4Z0D9W6_9FIRM|nr:ABC transporter ATP-binding protein [Soehngenia longivitae]TFZ41699.1 ABC transporter ATP-binding protein [Soehngenia longivitae]
MFMEIKNLKKSYKDNLVVENFTLEIEKREFVTILGASGCGKTTTLKMIGGFLKPDSGSITIDGKDITNLAANLRPTATVFQNYALFPNMNVIENVSYGLKFNKIKKPQAREIAKEMLETIGLKEHIYSDINKLSGGQMQRVALARALVLNPKVLLLDEPFSNLDAKLRVKMREEIKQIQHKFGITMIFVTHDQEEALSISDKVVIMNKGKIEQMGKPEEVYKNPKTLFVADFIGRINIIELDGEKKMIRPENIILDREKGTFLGKIHDKQFKGVYVTYFLNSDIGSLQVDALNSDIYEVGEKVYFSLKNN